MSAAPSDLIEQFDDPPVWQLFDKPLVDTSMAAREWVTYYDQTPTPSDSVTKFTVDIKDINEWIQLSDAMLEVKFKITKATDGTAFDAIDRVALNNSGFSLFERMILSAGTNIIEDQRDCGVLANILGHLDMSNDYQKRQATEEFWYKDSGAGGTDVHKRGRVVGIATSGIMPAVGKELATAEENADFNKGFRSRWQEAGTGGVVTVHLPLQRIFGFLKDIQCAMRNTPFKFEIYKAADAQAIYRASALNELTPATGVPITTARTVDGKVTITYLAIHVPLLKPSYKKTAELEMALSSGQTAVKRWYHPQTYKMATVASGNSPYEWPIAPSLSGVVTQVFVVARLKSALADQKGNKSIFANLGLTRAYLKIGQNRFPKEDYVANFTNSDYARLYLSWLEAKNRALYEDDGATITYKEYGTLYPILHFDLRACEPALFSATSTMSLEITHAAPSDFELFAVLMTEKMTTFSAIDGKMSMILA